MILHMNNVTLNYWGESVYVQFVESWSDVLLISLNVSYVAVWFSICDCDCHQVKHSAALILCVKHRRKSTYQSFQNNIFYGPTILDRKITCNKCICRRWMSCKFKLTQYTGTVEVGRLHTLWLESLKLVFQPLHKFLVNKL